MGPIDPEASAELQSELLSSESVLWAGRPNPSVRFHSDDWYLIPFSVAWVAFTAFWEAGVLGYWGNSAKNGVSVFMALWGIPFILIGQHMLWGRFVYDAWLKRRTYYGLTSRRILIAQEGWNRKTSSNYIDVLPTIQKEGGDIGIVWFGPKHSVFSGRRQSKPDMSRLSLGDVPVFVDIDDAESVYRMVVDLREQLTRKSSTFAN